MTKKENGSFAQDNLVQRIIGVITKSEKEYLIDRKGACVAGGDEKEKPFHAAKIVKTIFQKPAEYPGDQVTFLVCFEDDSMVRLFDVVEVHYSKPEKMEPSLMVPDKKLII